MSLAAYRSAVTYAEVNSCFERSMEAGEVTRKIRPSKPKTKSGKGTEVRSAADEARRREAIKENLREKLELERKALQIVERLLEDNVTEEFLISCVWHITPANYKDTVEERFIAKLCGYPLCSNKLINVPTQQFKISTKSNKVYDITERKCFCSNVCYKASKSFELQIPKTPLWLRKNERPPEIKLMEEEDGGSSGLEIKLVDKPITEADIENPVRDCAETSRDSPPFSQSESSDIEQDFVSSVVPRHHACVHWGKLPKRDGQIDRDRPSSEKMQTACLENPDSIIENTSFQSHPPQKDPEGSTTEDKCLPTEDKVTSDVEGTWELLKHCSLEDSHTISHQETSVPLQPEIGNNTPPADGLNVTQVGMSRRGAADLKCLLRDHKAKTAPTAISLCLLERLKQTFMEWRTEETMKFLYGPGYVLESTAQRNSEEELDEDDLDDAEVVEEDLRQSAGGPARPSAPAPDFQTLRNETEQLELRVKEFYKGVCVLPEKIETDSVKKRVDTEDSGKDPPLPLVDSQAQHLIQKRIAVEKLSRSLRDVVGPLRLTMSDVINYINNLVRTFRFTNTNILHKSPEWTLIAVVLLSVLTEVSPFLRESLASPSSIEYISSLMRELKLEDNDLQGLVLVFKPQITLCE